MIPQMITYEFALSGSRIHYLFPIYPQAIWLVGPTCAVFVGNQFLFLFSHEKLDGFIFVGNHQYAITDCLLQKRGVVFYCCC